MDSSEIDAYEYYILTNRDAGHFEFATNSYIWTKRLIHLSNSLTILPIFHDFYF